MEKNIKNQKSEVKISRDRIYAITSVIILITIMIFSISYILTEKKEFSENENRYLEEFPEFSFQKLLDGEYIPSIENYFIDHIIGRDIFIGIRTSLLEWIGQNKINGIYIGQDDFYFEEYNIEVLDTKIPYQTLNQFEKQLDEDIETSLMLVPTSGEIYFEKLPEICSNTSQKEVIDYVYSKIEFNTVDVYNQLIEKKNDELLYYKLDHHWTSFGAEIGYKEYMKSMNQEYLEYELNEVSDEFLGTIYSKLVTFNPDADKIHALKIDDGKYILSNPVTKESFNNIYFEEYLNEKDKYSYFVGQNQPILEINNLENTNGETLVIIKDSYANNLVPFLVSHYKKIYIIDPRYYRDSISEFVNQNDVQEVLIIYNMLTVESDLGIVNIK